MAKGNVPEKGWYSTEFWHTFFHHLVALAALVGVVAYGDVAGFQDALSKAVGAAAILIANAVVVIRYIGNRTLLKQLHLEQDDSEQTPGAYAGVPPSGGSSFKEPPEGGTPTPASSGSFPALPAVLFCLFLLGGAALAQAAPPRVVRTLAVRTDGQLGLLNIGLGRGQQQPQQQIQQPAPQVTVQTDPALTAAVQQMSAAHAALAAALQSQQKQAPSGCNGGCCQCGKGQQAPQAQTTPQQPPVVVVPPVSGCPCQPKIGQATPQQGQGPALGYAPAPIAQQYNPAPIGQQYSPAPIGQGYAPSPIGQGYNPQPIVIHVHPPAVVQQPAPIQAAPPSGGYHPTPPPTGPSVPAPPPGGYSPTPPSTQPKQTGAPVGYQRYTIYR